MRTERYGVAYVDPPWGYSNKRTRSAAAKEYPTMSLEELKLLPVDGLFADDAALFLWSTGPFLAEALALGAAWGFTYKTIGFLWAKRNRKANTPFFGMGNYTRANVEPCLLFTRGKPKVADRGVPQFYWGPILRHSEKPAAIRDRVARLMGDVPRVEFFSRHVVKGWARRFSNELLP